MLAEFYSRVQNQKESVKEFGESLLQIARKIMTTKPEFKVDIDNTLKARFADGLRDHYHQAMAREMIRSRPTLSYVAYKSEVLKTLGPNVKTCNITISKLETSDIESPPKKRKRDSELDQKINAAIEENRKLSERLSAFDPKKLLTRLSMQYKVVNQHALLQSNLDHRNSMANHANHSLSLVPMVR